MAELSIKGELSEEAKEQIRQIVREEMAALLGRQEKIALTVDGIKIAEILERGIN